MTEQVDLDALIAEVRGFADWWHENPQNSDLIYGIHRMVDAPVGKRVMEKREVTATSLRALADALESTLAELRQERERADAYRIMQRETAKTAREMRAESDAALSRAEETIEKVRAEADAYGRQPDVMEPCGAVAQSLLFILTDYDTDVSDRGVGEEHYRERRADAERVWAVFEAHVKESATSPERAKIGADSSHVTPTDDEREALIDVMVMTKISDYAATDMSTIHQAVDAILAAGFRRPVQGEPTDTQVRKVAHTGPGHASGDAGYCEGCLAEREQRAAGLIPGEPFTLDDLAREHERLAEHPNQMKQTIPAFHSLTAKALRWAALRAAGEVKVENRDMLPASP